MDHELERLSKDIGDWLAARGHVLATAESCTGGWIAEVVTATSGSSGWFDRGWITYSNEAKQAMLGVQAATLATHGAVSEAVVREMAEGALAASAASHAIAVSGVAGPTGGTPEKPVGTVWIAWAERGGTTRAESHRFDGDREAVRRQTVIRALATLIA
ncbi:nicotinamide-nucleotide amidase [Niveibacterium umoris]|uniref:Nicotinamide-nucleotide amidase n=2 Tax=Niveibacterium umoris TaxID=1193620 RepID=A0A840BI22_9RHOO|nr:nicotinamide-nucleotide amidase [Niveibacterium umoris]